MPDLRFTPAAAQALRAAIADAGGIEVFAVGDVDAKRRVERIEVHARGTEDAVLALQSRPRAGQVVIHNHPSGVLRPSEPDIALAHRFGEDGVGFVIVDSRVERSFWVVEPVEKRAVPVDPEELRAFFEERLPGAMPGWEPRPGQLAMARVVAAVLHEGGVSVLEAGTGTGKSLAYLAPAALWARANDAKVVVSTYTRTLQGQLVGDDLPTLARVLDVRFAVLKGRNNYLCRRKLEIARAEGDPRVEAVARWAETSGTGDVSEAGFDVDEEVWERVESDTDQTLRARCPHFNTCFYYAARRTAAAAHVIVVNHALLLTDLGLKAQEAPGILPRFDRVIVDEAHHLEQAATSVGQCRLSALVVSRAAAPVLGRGLRPGALARVAERWPAANAAAVEATDAVAIVRDRARVGFEGLSVDVPLRVRAAPPNEELFAELGKDLERAAARLGAVQAAVEDEDVRPADAQPLLDLGRSRRRLEEAAAAARGFLDEDPDQCRWLEPPARRPTGTAAVRAPVDVGPALRRMLMEGQVATVLTSATLAVHGRVEHFLGRTGLEGASFEAFPSPFDYAEQALLALPKDLPPPAAPGWLDAVSAALVSAIEASRGGAFVLCTSHEAVRQLSDRVESALGTRHAILRQGRGGKGRILEQFRRDRGAVLFGTDSFWEGVSVRGDGLRLVAIPRLPFRVPTEPVAEARYERIRDRGQDPFRAHALPEAVLKLRQGFGRLIRSGTDRGAVLVLDRRLHEQWYGRIFLQSLPAARRVVGPLRMVIERLGAFYGEWA